MYKLLLAITFLTMPYAAIADTGKNCLWELSEYETGPRIPLKIDSFADRHGRVLKATHKYADLPPVTIASNTYDAVGRVSVSERAGSDDLVTYYDYDVRSRPVSQFSSLYSQSLSFTPGGNVSRMSWNAADQTGQHSYTCSYDALSRLTSAYYGAASDKAFRYDSHYSYDANGNLLSILRHGLGDGEVFNVIDALQCEYTGNMLVRVTDSGTDPSYAEAFDFTDNRGPQWGSGDTEVDEYRYDANGNTVADDNKGLMATYDINNRPLVINLGLNNSTSYIYDDAGRKLRVTHRWTDPLWQPQPVKPGESQRPSSVTHVTDYCGNLVKRDGRPAELHFDGGYVALDDSVPSYRFFVTDHLGNVRVVADAQGAALQVNHYYPFGMIMGESTGGDVQRRKFGGKELDREGGLDLYDQEARLYDPAIARFLRPDDLAEKYPSVSPYAFCLNNPLRLTDPTGKKVIFSSDCTEEYIADYYKAFNYLKTHGVAGQLEMLESREETVVLTPVDGKSAPGNRFDGYTNTIYWDNKVSITTNTGYLLSPSELLSHEADHANWFLSHPNETNSMNVKDPDYGNSEERRVITGSEQHVAKGLKRLQEHEVTRTNHTGTAQDCEKVDATIDDLPGVTVTP